MAVNSAGLWFGKFAGIFVLVAMICDAMLMGLGNPFWKEPFLIGMWLAFQGALPILWATTLGVWWGTKVLTSSTARKLAGPIGLCIALATGILTVVSSVAIGKLLVQPGSWQAELISRFIGRMVINLIIASPLWCFWGAIAGIYLRRRFSSNADG